MVRKWRPPRRLMLMSTPQNCCHQYPCPHSEPQLPPASTGELPIPAGKSGPVSYEIIRDLIREVFFTWVLVHTRPCVHPPRMEFVSPSPMEFLRSNPADLQSQILWGLLLPLPDPHAGEPDMGLRTFTPVGELLWYNYFQFVSHPPGVYGI